MFLLLACAGWGQGVQNMEIIWMVGGIHSSGTIIEGTDALLTGTTGFVTQFNYGYQIKSTKAGNLWLETPMTFTWQGIGTISGSTVASIDRDVWYFTPGVRLKTPTFGRISFYGLAGGGYGWFSKVDSIVSGSNGTVMVDSRLQASPVFDFAGGIDLRLSRLVSLRGEGRDFFSAPNLGGVAGHNHPVFLAGLAFHF